MSEPKKKKKGNLPSKEDANLALEMIKVLQEKSDENSIIKKEQEEFEEKQKLLEEANKIQIQLAQELIKRKLRDNLKKKEEEKTKKSATTFLEKATVKNSKIKWKSSNGGHKLQGYVENKLFFEINRGLNLFSLYIKDKKFLKEKKISNSYVGCSTSILKLKHKSDKLI